MKKANQNDYYVFEVEEVVQNIKPFEQYEAFGEDLHNVIVKRKPILVTKQEDGTYTTKDGKVVVVESDVEKCSSSFRTKASVQSSIVGSGNVTSRDLELLGLDSENVAVLGKKQKGAFVRHGTPLGIYSTKYALPVPAEEYEKEMSILDKAKALIGKPIILSENKTEAAKQLAEIGIDVESMLMESQNQPQ